MYPKIVSLLYLSITCEDIGPYDPFVLLNGKVDSVLTVLYILFTFFLDLLPRVHVWRMLCATRRQRLGRKKREKSLFEVPLESIMF